MEYVIAFVVGVVIGILSTCLGAACVAAAEDDRRNGRK